MVARQEKVGRSIKWVLISALVAGIIGPPQWNWVRFSLLGVAVRVLARLKTRRPSDLPSEPVVQPVGE